MTDFAANLAAVRDRIARAVVRGGRNPDDVNLVAVSKGHPVAAIEAVYDLGVRDFGESYAQEWAEKAPALPRDIRWHFIGHLQSNKARVLADDIHLLHTVDRTSLAREVAKRWAAPCDALLQVNVDDDPAKKGADRADVEQLIDAIVDRYPLVRLRGLMTIPALADDPESSRPAFRRLAALRREIIADRKSDDRFDAFDQLSMGMTDDLEVAVEEGATLVRVGTAIFGPRST